MLDESKNSSSLSDHRARAARTKRIRSRARILDALLDCYPGRDSAASTVVNDIIERTGISRATFYKHFRSLDQAMVELAAQLSDEMIAAYGEVYWPVRDPVLRVATGLELFLCRAIMEPRWGAFICHLDRLGRDHSLIKQMKADLMSGAEAGVFDTYDIDAAIDVVVGAKSQAIKQIVAKGLSFDYVINIATFTITALGIEKDRARAVSQEALASLERDGLQFLNWWQPLR